MAAATVRIEENAHAMLREVAEAEGGSLSATLTRALEHYRRHVFLEGLVEDFAALRSDPKAWKEELDERDAWDSALGDGET